MTENQSGCFVWNTYYQSDQALKWTGECHDGLANDRGGYSFSSGSEHLSSEGIGTYVKGKTNGHWVVNWANGGRYQGELRDGQMYNEGTLHYADGGRYEGEWHDGQRHGQGTMTYASGSRYEGEWHHGKRQGHGINGRSRDGNSRRRPHASAHGRDYRPTFHRLRALPSWLRPTVRTHRDLHTEFWTV